MLYFSSPMPYNRSATYQPTKGGEVLTKQAFDEIFSGCKDKLTLEKPEDFTKLLKRYVGDDKTVNAFEMAAFAYLEAREYANSLVYSLLLEVLDIE